MEQKNYIPGFDWVRLFGCMIVVMAHCHLFVFLQRSVPVWLYALFCEIVPIFFIMSGYLMYRSLTTKARPVSYMMKYLWKYGSTFLVLNVIGLLGDYIQIYARTGEWMMRSLLIHILILPFYDAPMYQLWFIPSLLAGIVVNTFFVLKKKERFGWTLILLYATVVMFWNLYGQYMSIAPLYEVLTSWEHFYLIDYFLRTSTQGVLYVAIGMWIAKHDEQICQLWLRRLWLPALLVTAADTAVVALWGDPRGMTFTLSVCLWSTVLFIWIRRLKSDYLQPHHKVITIYSGTMYFLHVLQKEIFMQWTSNGMLIFLGILLTNVLLTWGFARHTKKKKLKLKIKNGL